MRSTEDATIIDFSGGTGVGVRTRGVRRSGCAGCGRSAGTKGRDIAIAEASRRNGSCSEAGREFQASWDEIRDGNGNLGEAKTSEDGRSVEAIENERSVEAPEA